MKLDTINGIRIRETADLACNLAAMGYVSKHQRDGEMSDAENDIAQKAARYLLKVRAKGYAKEQARVAFWNKLLSMAKEVRGE